MFGSVAKEIFAKVIGVDPAQIRVVSLMPCTAKKDEAARSELVRVRGLREGTWGTCYGSIMRLCDREKERTRSKGDENEEDTRRARGRTKITDKTFFPFRPSSDEKKHFPM